jgi:hypothetical protein
MADYSALSITVHIRIPQSDRTAFYKTVKSGKANRSSNMLFTSDARIILLNLGGT